MPIRAFDSPNGYSVGATAVVDSLRNINAVGGTYTARVSMAGGVTASQLFVGGTITAGTVSATTYRNLPVASAGSSGVASFNNQFVVSAAGAVGLTSNYIISANSLTGAVEVSGSTGIRVETIAASKRILVSLRTSNFDNLTANVTTFDTNTNSFVGVNGFNYDSGSGNLKIAGSLILADAQGNISFGDGTTQSTAARIRLASGSQTGVASFGNEFVVSAAGAVSLTGNYVRSFNGATGTVVYAPPIATSAVTGVASFTNDFVVSAAGAVSITSNNVYTVNGRTGNVGLPVASASVTGVASFGNEFIVSAAGAVSLTGNYVRSFNGATGTVVYAPPLATTSVTGVASFNTNDFTVTTGAVSLSNVARTNAANQFVSLQTFVNGISVSQGITASEIFVGGTITAGTVSATTYRNLPQASASVTGVASFGNEFIVSAAGAVSLTGNYVRSFNGSTGAVVYAPPLATTSVTGVASFNTNDFTVTTGAVSLSNVARTNAANTFTSAQTFNTGITTQSAFVSQGLTVGGRAAFNSGITSANLFVGAGTTLNSSLYVGGDSRLGGTTANTITLPNGQVIKTYFATSGATSTYSLITEPMSSSLGDMQSADILIHAETYGDDPATPGTEFGTYGVQNLRISVVALSSQVKHVQYGNVFVGQTAASFDVDLTGNEWRLRVTPNRASPTAVRAQAILSPNIGGLA